MWICHPQKVYVERLVDYVSKGVSIIIARQQQKGTAAMGTSTLLEGYSIEVTGMFTA